MYNTTSQFITNARALKLALLISMVTDKSIRIETGSAGSVPCVLDKPNQIILNRNFALQMVPGHQPPAPEPRFLNRDLLGKRIGIVTNYDALPDQPVSQFDQCVMLDIRSDSVPALPYAFRERACFSMSVNLPPDAVVELIDFVAEGPEFSDEAIFKLKAYAGTAARLGDRFRNVIGIATSFGNGSSVRCVHDLFHVCCADAAARGLTEFGEEDIVRLIEPVVAHRINLSGAAAQDYRQSLVKIAGLAVGR